MVAAAAGGSCRPRRGDGAVSGSAPSTEITDLLRAWSGGDERAGEQVMPLVMDELRGVARRALASERRGHTLQPTALVNEAYLRLAEQQDIDWRSRTHFFSLACTMMRRVLCDHAKRARRHKRGGGAVEVPLDDLSLEADEDDPTSLLVLDEAVQALAALDRRKAEVVMLHLFAGLSVAETAAAVGASPATVSRDWRFARAWLVNRLRATG